MKTSLNEKYSVIYISSVCICVELFVTMFVYTAMSSTYFIIYITHMHHNIGLNSLSNALAAALSLYNAITLLQSVNGDYNRILKSDDNM
jgi:hypothetical protein